MLVRIATDRPLLLIVLIVTLVALMTILEPTTFPRAANAAVVLLDTAQTGILACGMMVLLISGMFDLSIGGILAFSGIMAGLAAKNLGLPPIVAFLIGCGWGVLLGVINGVLVTRFKINALIATLATLSIYRGGLQLVSGAGVTNIGNGYTVFGQTKILGIYSPFWFMAVIVLLFAFLVGRTRYFRQAYYIGGNARAAKLSGINVDRTVFSFFAIMGLLAGLAGASAGVTPEHCRGARGARCRAEGHHRGGAGWRQPVGWRRHHLRRLPGRALHGAAAERHDHRRDQPLLAAHRGRHRAAGQRRAGPVRADGAAAPDDDIGETTRRKCAWTRDERSSDRRKG